MYKLILGFAFCLSLLSCQRKGKEDVVAETTDTSVAVSTTPAKDTTAAESKDQSILNTGKQILTALKKEDDAAFAEFIHPASGVRFSPYGYVDSNRDKRFTIQQFQKIAGDTNKIHWGQQDGSGDSIIMSFPQYRKKYIYDVDFLNAEKTSINKILGHGNSLINIDKVYPGGDYIEYHFSGFDKKYEGMDWRSLRLVFQLYEGKYYLVGVVHDQWTS